MKKKLEELKQLADKLEFDRAFYETRIHYYKMIANKADSIEVADIAKQESQFIETRMNAVKAEKDFILLNIADLQTKIDENVIMIERCQYAIDLILEIFDENNPSQSSDSFDHLKDQLERKIVYCKNEIENGQVLSSPPSESIETSVQCDYGR